MGKPAPLQHGRTYHIFARGNNREDIFIEPRNYAHFHRLYNSHIVPVADTHAYCLLKNHFHLVVRIREERRTGAAQGHLPRAPTPSQAFSNFLNAYAKAINKAYGRVGSLFAHPFGRIEVRREDYLVRLVVYVHRNPQRHGLATDFRTWRHSSYRILCSHRATHVTRDETLAWFGGLAAYRQAHLTLDEARSPTEEADDDTRP